LDVFMEQEIPGCFFEEGRPPRSTRFVKDQLRDRRPLRSGGWGIKNFLLLWRRKEVILALFGNLAIMTIFLMVLDP
jgi:hypothetical protein